MAHKFATNYVIENTSDYISSFWKLTRVMKAAGWLVKAHSDGVTKTAAGNNSNDSWGTNADPLLDALPGTFKTATQWTVMQGPSTFKVPLTTNPGAMIRGERVVQASSGAIGELLGIVFDSGAGYAVVAPRTGTFNSTNVFTGSQSGLSFTPSSTILEFTREVMMAKYTTSTSAIQMYYICADKVGESAQLFSTLASSAGCTAVIPPGCGGTSNAFPTLATVVRGSAGAATAQAIFNNAPSGYSQIGCANMVGSSTETVDGSFYVALNSSSSTTMEGLMFTRMDNTEPGDLDPYVFYFPMSASPSSWTRTLAAATTSSNTLSSASILTSGTAIVGVGYQSRGSGISGKDIVSSYVGTTLSVGTSPIVSYYYSSSLNVVNNLSATPTFVRLPIWLVSTKQTLTSNFPQVKGTMRWLFLSGIGNKLDLFDSRKTICVSSVASAGTPAVCLGPYDGTTIPLG